MMKESQRRLMQVFQIESNYQKHRKRLMSIQHINTKDKQHITTLRPSNATITYKQSRGKAGSFAQKNKSNKIDHENSILLSKIRQQHMKPNKTIQTSRPNSSFRRSVSSSQSSRSRDLSIENKRMFSKLNNTKSHYSKIRGDRNSKPQAIGNRQEIIHLLVDQLGVKPSVLFPKVVNKSLLNRSGSAKRDLWTPIKNPEKTLNLQLNIRQRQRK